MCGGGQTVSWCTCRHQHRCSTSLMPPQSWVTEVTTKLFKGWGCESKHYPSILHILEVSVPLANWWQLAACDWLIWWLSTLMWCQLPYLMWLYVSLHWHVCTCAWMCFLRKWMYSRILSFSHIRQLILEEHSTSYQVQSWNHHQGKQTSQHNAKPQLQKGKEMREKWSRLKEHFYKAVLLRHLFSKVEDHQKM